MKIKKSNQIKPIIILVTLRWRVKETSDAHLRSAAPVLAAYVCSVKLSATLRQFVLLCNWIRLL